MPKPFNPAPGDPGSVLTFTYEGREITGQVWSAAPAQPERVYTRPDGTRALYGRKVRAVWIVADGVAYLVNRKGVVCGVA